MAAADTTTEGRRRVRLGVIVGAHGLKGEVRILSHTARPEEVGGYGPLEDAAGRRKFTIEVRGRGKGTVIGRIAGVEDRAAAETLKGTELFVARAALKAPAADEFYHADLIGLEARLGSGDRLGRVACVHNFGAGDVLEVEPAGKGATIMVPFTKESVPVVDTDEGFVVLVPPPGQGDEKATPTGGRT